MHNAGVSFLVTAPERYAIQKLIIAIKRNAFLAEKAKKDINQAGALIPALEAVKRSGDLGVCVDGSMGTRSQMATTARRRHYASRRPDIADHQMVGQHEILQDFDYGLQHEIPDPHKWLDLTPPDAPLFGFFRLVPKHDRPSREPRLGRRGISSARPRSSFGEIERCHARRSAGRAFSTNAPFSVPASESSRT
ncbi:GSU2403 family nucleotidyltransferase fold protein [Bradyrhizobium yuanmingense]|uniref:GSU2403 family nucleotidyltransferase fold protein n=1 Tax=Bradyrhizobium yuanmingense TaxID=108015 RepID=UPI003511F1A6